MELIVIVISFCCIIFSSPMRAACVGGILTTILGTCVDLQGTSGMTSTVTFSPGKELSVSCDDRSSLEVDGGD